MSNAKPASPISRATRVLAAASVLAAVLSAPVLAADSVVRVGVLKFGTVNWELDVIKTHGLDAKHGVELKVIPLGSKRGTSVALQGDAADVIVTDWIWVSRQRAEGKDYAFVPYSLAVGGVMVRPDAGVAKVSDLKGKRVGVAGGPVDKSWLLLRAYTRQQEGYDLADEVEPTFGAPPLLNELITRGDLPAVLNFWHYNARLKAAGMRELITVEQILPALGVDGSIPLLGWVFDRSWGQANEETLVGFVRASYDAKRLLLDSDAEWDRLKPRMKAESDEIAVALRDAYRAGVPRKFDAGDQAAAGTVFELLAKVGGSKLVGSSTSLTEGTFWSDIEIPAWSQ